MVARGARPTALASAEKDQVVEMVGPLELMQQNAGDVAQEVVFQEGEEMEGNATHLSQVELVEVLTETIELFRLSVVQEVVAVVAQRHILVELAAVEQVQYQLHLQAQFQLSEAFLRMVV